VSSGELSKTLKNFEMGRKNWHNRSLSSESCEEGKGWGEGRKLAAKHIGTSGEGSACKYRGVLAGRERKCGGPVQKNNSPGPSGGAPMLCGWGLKGVGRKSHGKCFINS